MLFCPSFYPGTCSLEVGLIWVGIPATLSLGSRLKNSVACYLLGLNGSFDHEVKIHPSGVGDRNPGFKV
jgi:hypothetical protein